MSMYQIFKNTVGDVQIKRTSDDSFIPPDPLNPDYLQYVAWLFEGNEPEVVQPESENQ